MTYNSTMTGYMNSTDDTTGGYYNSYMCQTTLPAIANKLKNVLGSHMVNRNVTLTNSTSSSGSATGWRWYNEYLTLMSEIQVYGSIIWSSGGYDIGEAKEKLPLFNYVNYNVISRQTFWLRSVASSTRFSSSDGNGAADCRPASYVYWVRPLLYIN